jgi:hypothetical protein
VVNEKAEAPEAEGSGDIWSTMVVNDVAEQQEQKGIEKWGSTTGVQTCIRASQPHSESSKAESMIEFPTVRPGHSPTWQSPEPVLRRKAPPPAPRNQTQGMPHEAPVPALASTVVANTTMNFLASSEIASRVRAVHSNSPPTNLADDLLAQLMPTIDRIVEEKVQKRLAEEKQKIKEEILASLQN